MALELYVVVGTCRREYIQITCGTLQQKFDVVTRVVRGDSQTVCEASDTESLLPECGERKLEHWPRMAAGRSERGRLSTTTQRGKVTSLQRSRR